MQGNRNLLVGKACAVLLDLAAADGACQQRLALAKPIRERLCPALSRQAEAELQRRHRVLHRDRFSLAYYTPEGAALGLPLWQPLSGARANTGAGRRTDLILCIIGVMHLKRSDADDFRAPG